jgi:hypothetical protein
VQLRESAPLPDHAWLEERLTRLNAATLRSVSRQTSRNFKWLLLMDHDTPRWARLALNKMTTDVPTASLVYIKGVAEGPVIRNVVRQHLDSQYCITSRCDSDDRLAFDYIEQLQTRFDKEVNLDFLNFPIGLQWAAGRPLLHLHRSNPFISCFERVHGHGYPQTVHARWHNRVAEVGPVVQTPILHPLWMQEIHDGNVANVECGARVPLSVASANFDMTGLELRREAAISVAADYIQSGARYVRRLAEVAQSRMMHRMHSTSGLLGPNPRG